MVQYQIGCLVMAAGSARRYRANKLTQEFSGKSLFARTLAAIDPALFSCVTVVSQYPELEAFARQMGFCALHNNHPDWGVSHTIALGTRHMSGCDGILYCVSDQPLLSRQSVGRVVEEWLSHPDCIVGAGHGGERGNPNLFPRACFPELLALTGDCGGGRIIRAHPEHFRLVEIPPWELADVDTPEAFESLQQLDGCKEGRKSAYDPK